MTEPTTVDVDTVAGIERCKGTGEPGRTAVVELSIGGVCLAFQGVQVRDRNGKYLCQAPAFRHPRTGQWLPAIIAPQELTDALGQLVVAEMERPPEVVAA